MILKNDPRPHFCGECRGTMIVFEHWFTYTTPLSFTRFKGIIKAFSGMCLRLTSITFPVIWPSVLISVAWVALLWAGHVFPNKKYRAKMFVYPVPKISQVMMKWCRRASHLGRFTLWNNGRRATQLSRFTLWHNRRWASQLAGKFTLWHNGRRAKQPGLMHAPGVARIFQRKIWRLNPK